MEDVIAWRFNYRLIRLIFFQTNGALKIIHNMNVWVIFFNLYFKDLVLVFLTLPINF